MDDEIYTERIKDHYEEPFHRGHLPHPTHAHEDDNPLCGDVVRIELSIDPAGRIADAYFSGDGCCISQAAASILLEHFNGKTVDEVSEFEAQKMLELFGPRLTPNRQKCCLLSWKVLKQAVHAPVSDGPSSGKRVVNLQVPARDKPRTGP